MLYNVQCCTLFNAVQCSILYTVQCCTLFNTVHCSILNTAQCCTLSILNTVQCCTLFNAVQCSMLYTVQCCTLSILYILVIIYKSGTHARCLWYSTYTCKHMHIVVQYSTHRKRRIIGWSVRWSVRLSASWGRFSPPAGPLCGWSQLDGHWSWSHPQVHEMKIATHVSTLKLNQWVKVKSCIGWTAGSYCRFGLVWKQVAQLVFWMQLLPRDPIPHWLTKTVGDGVPCSTCSTAQYCTLLNTVHSSILYTVP